MHEDATSPIDIFALTLAIEGISLFLYPLGDGISGMCIKSDDTAVIAINSAMSKGRKRFSLAHELYHYRYGKAGETAICSPPLIMTGLNGMQTGLHPICYCRQVRMRTGWKQLKRKMGKSSWRT